MTPAGRSSLLGRPAEPRIHDGYARRLRRTVGLSLLGHCVPVVALVLLAGAMGAGGPPAPTPTPQVVLLTQDPVGQLQSVLAAAAAGTNLDPAAQRRDGDLLSIGGYEIDLEKLRPGTDLFPFLLDAPRFHGVHRAARESSSIGPFLVATGPPTRSGRPALDVSPEELQALVDQLWSRRNRWDDFRLLPALLDRFDADAGVLPTLVKAHLDQNMLQPYGAADLPDPRLWVMLEIASEHRHFIEFALRYVDEHPGTKAATELLFLLDELAVASANTLELLLATPPDELQWTRATSRSAHQLFAMLHAHYGRVVEVSGLDSQAARQQLYSDVRLTLLDTIRWSSPRGYRVNDASFLMGRIYWAAGRVDAALSAWRDIRPTEGDLYRQVSESLLTELDRAARTGTPVQPEVIDESLRAERRRWAVFSVRRLDQFGFTPSTF